MTDVLEDLEGLEPQINGAEAAQFSQELDAMGYTVQPNQYALQSVYRRPQFIEVSPDNPLTPKDAEQTEDPVRQRNARAILSLVNYQKQTNTAAYQQNIDAVKKAFPWLSEGEQQLAAYNQYAQAMFNASNADGLLPPEVYKNGDFNYATPDDLRYFGKAYRQSIGQYGSAGEFGRVYDITMYRRDINELYRKKQIDAKTRQRLLDTAEQFDLNAGDSSVLAELSAGLIGAVKDNPGALAGTALFLALTAGTGTPILGAGTAVSLGVGGTFAVDDFKQSQAEIAGDAQRLDPTLTQDEALYGALPGAAVRAALDIVPAPITYGSLNRFTAKLAKKNSDDFIAQISKSRAQNAVGKSAKEKAVADNIAAGKAAVNAEIKAALGTLAADTASNAVVGGAQGAVSQINTNVLGGQEWYEDVISRAGQEALANAVGGAALNAPFAAGGFALQRHLINQAVDSLNKNIADSIETATAKQTDAYRQDPDRAARMVDEVRPDKRFYFDAGAVRERADALGVDPGDAAPAFKQLDDAEETTGVISMSEGEYLQMSDSEIGRGFADLRSSDAGAMSSQQAAEVLKPESQPSSPEEQQRLAEDIAEQTQTMQAQEDAREADLDLIRQDVFKQMREGTTIAPRQIDGLSQAVSAFFDAMSQFTGVKASELYSRYSGGFFTKEHRLNLSQLTDDNDIPEVRGYYIPNDKSITYEAGANFTTGLHEVGHFFLDTMVRLSAENPTNYKLKSAIGYLEKDLGLKEGSLARMAQNSGMWTDLSAAEPLSALEARKYAQAQEDFVYGFLSYVISGKAPNAALEPLFKDFKVMLRNSERRIQADLFKQQGKDKNYEALVEADYEQRFGKPMPQFSHRMDYFLKRMFLNEEAFNAIDAEYPLRDPYTFVDRKNMALDEEGMRRLSELDQEVQAARDEVQAAIDQNLADDLGVMMGTGKKVQARLKKMLEQTPEGRGMVRDYLTNHTEAVQIYREEFAKALTAVGRDRLSQVRNALDEYKLNPEALKTLVKNNVLTRSEANALRDKGYVAEGGADTAFLASLVKGWDEEGNLPAAGASQYAQGVRWLRALASAPDKYSAARVKAIQSTIARVKGGNKYFIERADRNRQTVINAHRKILTAADRFLKQLMKRPADDPARIKMIAAGLIQEVRYRDLNDRHFSTLAKRSHLEGERYFKKLDLDRASRSLRTERVNIELADNALKIKQALTQRMKKQQSLIGKLNNRTENVAKSYDVNYLTLAQHLLANLGLARKTDAALLQRILAADEGAKELFEKAGGLASQPRYYGSMSVREINSALDLIDGVINEAKKQRSQKVGARTMSMNEIAEQAAKQFIYRKDAEGNLTDIEYKDAQPYRRVKVRAGESVNGVSGEGVSFSGSAVSKGKKSLLRSLRFNLARVSTECYAKDGKMRGFLHQVIYQPVRDAVTANKLEQVKLIRELQKIINSRDWAQGKLIATELKDQDGNPYVFGANGDYHGCGQLEVLGLLLHLGNDSNTAKLIGGYGWDVDSVKAFIQRGLDEGWIDEGLLDTAQALWDLYDRVFQKAQDAHYALHGYRMTEVEKRPVLFTVNGKQKRLRGGYAPALANKDIAKNRINTFKDLDDLENQIFIQNYPTVPTGWSKQRNERFYQALELNPLQLSRQVLQVSAYAHIMPAVNQVNSIFKKQVVKDALGAKDPYFYDDLVKPFLVSAARNNMMQALGDPFTENIISAAVRGVGRGIMFANFANAAQQVTGVAQAATLVKPKYLAKASAEVCAHRRERYDFFLENSDFMRLRLVENSSNIEEIMREVCLDPSRLSGRAKAAAAAKNANEWTKQHAYFAQKIVQNQVDLIVADAAYRQAVEQGKSHAEAIKDAEEVVRLTQSSFDTIDISRLENSSALMRAFTQFCNYFYTVMNLQAAELRRVLTAVGENTLARTARLTVFFLMGVYVPSIVADAITKLASGDWWNDEDSPSVLMADNLLGAPLRTIFSAVPGGSSLFNSFWNPNVLDRYYYNEAFGNLPVLTTVQNFFTAFGNAADEDEGELTGRDIRNIGAALGVIFPILAPLSRYGGYQFDVAMGNVEPTSWADYVRGTLTGRASADSKD